MKNISNYAEILSIQCVNSKRYLLNKNAISQRISTAIKIGVQQGSGKTNLVLMIQVFDFVDLNYVKRKNKYHFKGKSSQQGETYGFISFDVDKISEEYIYYFEKNVPTAHAQYIFEKDL